MAYEEFLGMYQSKLTTAEEAVKVIKSGDWVDYGFGAGFPELLDRALAARRDELTDVKIRGGLVIRPRIEVVESDPDQKAFSYYSWHIGDYERKLQTRGLCKFMPMMLRSLPEMYRHHIRVDVAFVPVSRPDADGCCGLGISNYAWRTIFENARTVIFEINERLPRLQGVDGSHRVHLSEADFIVEGEHEPLPIRTYRDPSAVDIEIAKRVVEEIPDGAVLSLGVGGVPFTVANMLAQSDKTDLGCHTGTISDAFLALYKAGKLTNKKKEIDNGYSTWNLAMGSQELYDWLDNEPQLFHQVFRFLQMDSAECLLSGCLLSSGSFYLGSANTDSLPMLFPPTTAALFHLYQLMFCKLCFALFHITHDIFKVSHIAVRIKRLCCQFKRDSFFPCYLLQKDVNCS